MLSKRPVTIMNLVDTLAFGGTERMAINIVNHLPQDRYRAVLCTTRADGAQSDLVAPHVTRLRVHRRSVADHARAVSDLVRFIRSNDVRILHAHSSTLFLARAAGAFCSGVSIVWHAHWGKLAAEGDSALPYRVACYGIGAALAANEDLRRWIADQFPIAKDRVHYLPNIATPPTNGAALPDLPGVPGKRILCVANIRPEKDHVTLIRAMGMVKAHHPDAHLILVGVPLIPESVQRMQAAVAEFGLQAHVTYLGPRSDAREIMRACDIGVLSSVTEGLPVSLLEYGMAELPVVTTPAGQSGEVIGGGEAGLLVPAESPEVLAQAISNLLSDESLRMTLSRALFQRVNAVYSPSAVLGRLTTIYDSLL